MSVRSTALLLPLLLLAAAIALYLVTSPPRAADDPGVMLALVLAAAGLFGLGIGVAALRRQRRDEPAEAEPMPAIEAPAPRDESAANVQELVTFTQHLFGATTTDELRSVIAQKLPPLLGTPRVWITSRLGGRRGVIVPEGLDDAQREGLLTEDFQQWSTVVLRLESEVLGVLGVEAPGGLTPRARRLVELVAPTLAHALNSAHTMDSLRETTLVDLLTGVSTRREGLTRLHAEIKRAQRTGSTMAVLMLDLDRFKSINDRFGHATGDAVLSAVGRIMSRTLRASDLRCRWGGEEFLIVLPETDLARAQVVANGLLRNIASNTIPTPEGPVGTSVSIGLTISRAGETNVDAMLRRADIALYRAKESGRGCIRVVLGDGKGEPIGGGLRPAAHTRITSRESDRQPMRDSASRESVTLPFPDRRHPERADRRRVPSPGRRSTDPRPSPTPAPPPQASLAMEGAISAGR